MCAPSSALAYRVSGTSSTASTLTTPAITASRLRVRACGQVAATPQARRGAAVTSTVDELGVGAGRPGGARDAITRGLGWFSLGLGTAQVVSPRLVNKIAGIDDGRTARLVQRAVGVRELGAAAGIATQPRPTGF